MKTFNVMSNVGKAKYLVSFHDGVQAHKDGSPFYDIAIFRNKKKLDAYVRGLTEKGYARS